MISWVDAVFEQSAAVTVSESVVDGRGRKKLKRTLRKISKLQEFEILKLELLKLEDLEVQLLELSYLHPPVFRKVFHEHGYFMINELKQELPAWFSILEQGSLVVTQIQSNDGATLWAFLGFQVTEEGDVELVLFDIVSR